MCGLLFEKTILIITLIGWQINDGPEEFGLHFFQEVYIGFAAGNTKFSLLRIALECILEENSRLDMNEVSRDSLFDGDLVCLQHSAGYRFSIDAVLIAHFVEVRSDDRILDMGTGCGIIMLILLYRWRNRLKEIVGLEIQQGLAGLAARNLQANRLGEKGRVVTGDLRNILDVVRGESFDTIVCNPPFYQCGSGRESDNMEARLARHQCLANLDDFLRGAALAVRNKGSVYFIYPAEQIGSFLAMAGTYRLEVKKLQFIYSYPQEGGTARLVMIHCVKNGGPGTRVLPPLYVYSRKNGAFSPEMQKFYKKISI